MFASIRFFAQRPAFRVGFALLLWLGAALPVAARQVPVAARQVPVAEASGATAAIGGAQQAPATHLRGGISGGSGTDAAQTFLTMKSDPGDYIGGGQTYAYTPQTGSFSVSAGVGADGKANYVSVYYNDSAGNFWSVNIGTDKIPAPLAPGYYHNAERSEFADPGHPGLDVYGNGAGSNTLTGEFQVLDAAFTYVGGQVTVKSFAVKFAQHSEGAAPALHGIFLYNSSVNPTDTSAPQTTAAISGSVVTLTATDADGSGDVDSTYYQIDHGAAVYYEGPFTLSGPLGQPHTITCWSIDLVGNTEKGHDFTLKTADDGSVNRIALQSDSGDAIGGGNNFLFTAATGSLNLQTAALGQSGQANRTTLTYADAAAGGHTFSVTLGTDPIPAPLAPGYYNKAQIVGGYNFGQGPQAGFPGLDAMLDQRGSSTLTGGFQIIGLQVNNSGPTPQIVSLTARFVQHSNGAAPALRGAIQFNASAPIPPDTTTPVTTASLAADIVTLSATDADDPKDVDRTYYQIDHGTTRVYTGPFPIFGPIGATHIVTAWSEDIAGNAETPTDTAFVVNSLAPASQLVMRSQSGDYIGEGLNYLYDNSTGTFTGYGGGNGAAGNLQSVAINYEDPNFPYGNYWTLNFNSQAIPAPLVPGYYDLAERAPFVSAGHSGLEIYGDGRGSNTLTGGFQVFDAVYDTVHSKLISFAARFVQHSEGGSAALYGTILYNSTATIPPDNTAPVTTAASSQNIVTLYANDPDSPKDLDRTYYQIDHGATLLYSQPFLVSGAPNSTHTITAWSLDIAGNQETPHDTPVVIDPNGAVTQLNMQSEPGDYIGGGQNYHYDTNTGFFNPSGGFANGQLDSVTIYYSGANNYDFWDLDFNTYHVPEPMPPGYYAMAERAAFADPGHPGLDVSGNGRGSNTLMGAFQIFDASYVTIAGQTQLASFAARFVEHSEGGLPALRGVIQINSKVPIPTDTSAPTTTATQSANQITLTVTDPDSNQDVDRTYYQIDHGVTRIYASTFTVGGSVGSTHTVTIWSVDIAGNQETPHNVSVYLDGSGPQTYLSMTSQPGDYIGGGRNYLYDTNSGAFGASLNMAYGSATPSGVSVNYNDYYTSGVYGNNWELLFSTAQTTRPFTVGNYDYAQREPFAAAGFPGLEINGDGRGSNTLTGRFTVFELVVDNSGAQPLVTRFGATFEQHSEGGQPALFGVIRYNSLIAPPPPSPFTTASVTGTTGLNGWYKSPVQVSLSAENPYSASPLAGTQYRVDGAAFQPYTAPFSLSGEGAHALQYQSIDGSGSQEPVENQAIKIDSTPPTLTGTLTSGGISGSELYLTITGVFADATSGINPNSLACAYLEETQNYQGYGYAYTQSSGAYSVSLYVPAPSPTAKKLKYRITLTGQDMAGNVVTKTFVTSAALK